MASQTSNTNPTNPPTGFEAKLTQAVNGAKNLPSSGFNVSIGGVSFDGPGLASKLQAMLQPYTDARAAKVAWAAKVQTKKAQAKSSKALFTQMNAVLVNSLGATNPILGQMGLEARKEPAPLSTAKQLVKVSKAKATRVARGTTGPAAKASIVGTVGDIVVSPDGVAQPAATPAPAPAPAAAPTPAPAQVPAAVNGSHSP